MYCCCIAGDSTLIPFSFFTVLDVRLYIYLYDERDPRLRKSTDNTDMYVKYKFSVHSLSKNRSLIKTYILNSDDHNKTITEYG